MRGNIGVHQSHCCKWHGCKYGDPDCPVVGKVVEQSYLCEECYEVLHDESHIKQILNDIEEIKLFCKEKGIKI